ncbi:MAG: hypothetical protein RLZZ455_710 [Candidatus Parcubacteria bacterium]|jgi:hypothetical protein
MRQGSENPIPSDARMPSRDAMLLLAAWSNLTASPVDAVFTAIADGFDRSGLVHVGKAFPPKTTLFSSSPAIETDIKSRASRVSHDNPLRRLMDAAFETYDPKVGLFGSPYVVRQLKYNVQSDGVGNPQQWEELCVVSGRRDEREYIELSHRSVVGSEIVWDSVHEAIPDDWRMRNVVNRVVTEIFEENPAFAIDGTRVVIPLLQK